MPLSNDLAFSRDDLLAAISAMAPKKKTADDPAVVEFETARRGAAAYLPQVNRLITEALGVDVAVLGRAGAC